MRGRLIPGAVALAGSLSLATNAPAQQAGGSVGQRTQASASVGHVIRIGPLELSPSLVLESAGTNDNVFNSRTSKVGDQAIVLVPSLGGRLPLGRRLTLTGDGRMGVHYFYRQTGERSLDYSGSGRAEFDFGLVSFYAGGGGGQARSRFSLEVDERLLRQNKSADAGVSLHLGRRISLVASGRTNVTRHEPGFTVSGNDVRTALDNSSVQGSTGIRVALTNKTTLALDASLIENRFISATGTGTRKSRSYRYQGGFEFNELAFLSGQIRAGIRDFPGGGPVPPYRGLFLDVDTSLPLLREGRLSLTATRDVNFAVTPAAGAASSSGPSNSFVATSFGATYSKVLPFDLQATLGGRFQESRYVLPVDAGGGQASLRVDHRWSVNVRLLRALTRWLRLGGTATWAQRRSNVAGQDYQGFVYGLTGDVTP